MRYFLVAAAVALTAAAPACARDAPFTGFHLEAVGAYESLHVGGSSETGFLYGIAGGYDFAAGGAVVGIDAEATNSANDACHNSVLKAGDRLCGNFGRDLYVGGRAGAAVAPNVLLYAKAGYVNGRARTTYDDGTAATATDFRLSRNLDGVRVGIGADIMLGRSAFARVEYRYTNHESDVERHQGLVGLGIRF